MTINELLEEKLSRCKKYQNLMSIKNPFSVSKEHVELLRNAPVKNSQVTSFINDYFYITSCLKDIADSPVLTYGDLNVAEVAITTVMLKESEVIHYLGYLEKCEGLMKRRERLSVDRYIHKNISYLSDVWDAATKLLSLFNNILEVPEYMHYREK